MTKNHYQDIIHLPYRKSPRHPQMTNEQRAAQFAPFAALTGHEAAIKEVARFTDSKVELDETRIEAIHAALHKVSLTIKNAPLVSVTYFKPDDKKGGGAYVTVQERVRKIDAYHQHLVFESGAFIPITDIFTMECLEVDVHPDPVHEDSLY